MSGRLLYHALVIDYAAAEEDDSYSIPLWKAIMNGNREMVHKMWVPCDTCTVPEWYLPAINGQWVSPTNSQYHMTLAIQYTDIRWALSLLSVHDPSSDVYTILTTTLRFGNTLGKNCVSLSYEAARTLFLYTRDCSDMLYSGMQRLLLKLRILRVYKIALYRVECNPVQENEFYGVQCQHHRQSPPSSVTGVAKRRRSLTLDVSSPDVIDALLMDTSHRDMGNIDCNFCWKTYVLYVHCAHVENLRIAISRSNQDVIQTLFNSFDYHMYRIVDSDDDSVKLAYSFIRRARTPRPTDTFDHLMLRIIAAVLSRHEAACHELGCYHYYKAAQFDLLKIVNKP